VRRILVLFHDPYHLRAAEAQAWIEAEVAAVMRRDQVRTAKLTRLGEGTSSASGGFDWLLEFGVAPSFTSRPTSAVGEVVADLRMLGMAPLVAVADDRNAVEVSPE
jgi:hypothetical protein